MAESSRVATLVASLMDEEPTEIPPSAPWSSEILAGRARAGRRMYPVLFLLGVAVIGALWFTSVDRNRTNADVQVVRDLLVEADAAEVRWLDDGALGLRGVLEAAPGDPGDVPLEPTPVAPSVFDWRWLLAVLLAVVAIFLALRRTR